VIGAGPIGSYIALNLANRGYNVAVLERHSAIGTGVCCTGIVGTECFHKFPLSGTDIFYKGSTCNVFTPSGQLLRLEKESTQAYVINRPGLDCNLASQAQAEGADYLLSTKVRNVYRVDHRVRAEVEVKNRSYDIDGKVVIVSNGFGFSLPRRMGMGQVGDYVFGAQVEVEAKEVKEVEVYLGREIAPGFFAWVVPASSGSVLVGLLSRNKPAFYIKKLLSKLIIAGKIKQQDAKINFGGIPLKPLPRTFDDRIVVVGDAAGQVKPTTGGGIYYGLLSAEIAVDVIHRGLCVDDLSARFLRQYESGWKRLLARDLQIGYWARRVYERFNDESIDRIIEQVRCNGMHKSLLNSDDFSFDWHSPSIIQIVRDKELRKLVWSAARSLLPF